MDLLYKEESYSIIGACYEVYNELGCGFLEAVYQEALGLELQSRGIPFEEQPKLEIRYKGTLLEKHYEPDFVIHSKIIVELKAVKSLEDSHRAQLFNYMKANNIRLGLLINFGNSKNLIQERIVK